MRPKLNFACSVADCQRPARSKHLCKRHYERQRVTGNVELVARPPRPRKPRAACKIDGCENASVGRGWCHAHYNRWRLKGSPEGQLRASPGEPENYFRTKVLTTETDDCIFWPYSHSGNGYATLAGKHLSRLACIEVNGPPPSDLHEAAHSCGRGKAGCVNPRHVRWATCKENHADKIGHGTTNRGERQWCAKLSVPDVRMIRELARSMPQKDIAELYGVRGTAISKIVNRKTWAWLD